MIVINAKTRGAGFSAGFDRRENIPVSTSYISESFSRVFDVSVLSSVVATCCVSSLVALQSQLRAIASGFFRVEINAYIIAIGASIPETFSGLTPHWSGDFQYPHESNLYAGRVSEKIEIPLSAGRYLIEVILFDAVNIPTQPQEQRLQIFDHVDISGIPASREEEYFQQMILSLGDTVAGINAMSEKITTETARLETLIAKADDQIESLTDLISLETSDNYATVLSEIKSTIESTSAAEITAISGISGGGSGTDYTAKLNEISGKLDTIHQDLL